MGNSGREASDRFEFVRLDKVHPRGLEFRVGFGQRRGASLDPLFKFNLDPLEGRQKLNEGAVDKRGHRSIPIGHERVGVVVAQRKVAGEPCCSAQQANQPTARAS